MNIVATWDNKLFDLSKCFSKSYSLSAKENPQSGSDVTEVDESYNRLFEELRGKKVFLDAAREDKGRLIQYKKNIVASFLEPKSDTTAEFEQLEKYLDSCEVIVTFYDQAPYGWLKNRLAQYQISRIKKVKEQRQQVYILSSKQEPQNLPDYVNWITDK